MDAIDSKNRLDFRASNLREVPDEVFSYPDIQELNLTNNLISDLPKNFATLKSLRVLHLNMCSFDRIPECIFELKDLEELHMSANFLKQIDPRIAQLKKLRVLDLGNGLENKNEITEIPEILFTMTSLEELDLDENPIQEISDKIGNLENLKVLSLREVPAKVSLDEVSRLKKLESLTLGPLYDEMNPELIDCLKKLVNLKEVELPLKDANEWENAKRLFAHLKIWW